MYLLLPINICLLLKKDANKFSNQSTKYERSVRNNKSAFQLHLTHLSNTLSNTFTYWLIREAIFSIRSQRLQA